MNNAMKQSLDAVIKGLVNDDPKMASDALHEYLRMKAQAILVGESDEEMDDKEEVRGDDEGDEREERHADDEGDEHDEGDEKCEECGEMPCECPEEDDKKSMKESATGTTPHGASVKGSLDSKGKGKHFAAGDKGTKTPHGASVKGSLDSKAKGKHFHSAPKGDGTKKGASVRGSYDS